MSIKEQMDSLNYKSINRKKMENQQKEYDGLPGAIIVTYVGEKSFFSHRGRSRIAKRDPYRFHKDKPLVISEPDDVKYFLRQKSKDFKIEEVTEQAYVEEEFEEVKGFEVGSSQKDKVEKIQAQEAERISKEEAIAKKKAEDLKKAEGINKEVSKSKKELAIEEAQALAKAKVAKKAKKGKKGANL